MMLVNGEDIRHRDLRLDACRGLALWFIFLDHIPDNILSWLTLRNYGFSDTTEVFVFVSGYTCMLAYGEVLRKQGWFATLAHALRRSWQIYIAFLILLLAYLALVQIVGGGRYLDETNTAVFFDHPAAAILHAVTIRYTPVNTDVLPTFILLHLIFPVLLWLLTRIPLIALGASFLLYALVQAYSWDLASWPRGEWFFNPLAWQVLFVFGAWYAIEGHERLGPVLRSRAALALAILYLAFSFSVVLGWHIHALEKFLPDTLSKLLYPIDKSDLAIVRLLHFFALAVVAARLVPRDWHGLSQPWMIAIIRCGENSLAIYCLSVLLSFIGHVALEEISGSIAMQIGVSLVGIAFIICAATLMTWTAKLDGREPKLF